MSDGMLLIEEWSFIYAIGHPSIVHRRVVLRCADHHPEIGKQRLRVVKANSPAVLHVFYPADPPLAIFAASAPDTDEQ